MRRVALTVGFLLLVAAVIVPAASASAARSTPGATTTLRTYDPDASELPEGIAVDKRGNVYLTMPFIGELRRINRDGSEELVAELPTGGGFGPLGLAVDATGDVYVGVVTFDPATQGVYRVTPEGLVSLVPGTDVIAFANGLAFGDGGTLYVADSTGTVWRVPKGGVAEPWAQSPLLVGTGEPPLPLPIGANGIAYRHRTVYVTNTQLGSIVAIPVLPRGDAGTPVVLVQDDALAGADGLAVDVHGGLYVAVISQSSIVRVTPDGSTIDVLADGSDGLDFASSVAFGTGRGERTTLFAVNFSVAPLFGGTRTSGPALLAVETSVPGLPVP